MALGIHPVCNCNNCSACGNLGGVTGAHTFAGVDLLDALHVLDELASALGVQALSAYADNRDWPADFEGQPEDAFALLGPREDWYPIGDGVASCEALLGQLQAHPQAEVNPQALQELAVLCGWLKQRRASCAQFRLEVASSRD